MPGGWALMHRAGAEMQKQDGPRELLHDLMHGGHLCKAVQYLSIQRVRSVGKRSFIPQSLKLCFTPHLCFEFHGGNRRLFHMNFERDSSHERRVNCRHPACL